MSLKNKIRKTVEEIDTPIRVYVAGPIRGDGITPPEVSLKAALDYGDKLLRAGVYPFVPHLSLIWNLVHYGEFDTWIRYDFVWLKQCHAVFRMPGFSKGADMEVTYAKETLKIPVYTDVFALITDVKNKTGPIFKTKKQRRK